MKKFAGLLCRASSRLFFALLLTLLLIIPASAQNDLLSIDQRERFNVAREAFYGGFYKRADTLLTEFHRKYPNASIMPKVQLLWARTRFEDGQPTQALQILFGYRDRAGNLADQYAYWAGESRYAREEYSLAAEEYATVYKKFPKSELALNARYHEALSYFQLSNYHKVVSLLEDRESPFFITVENRSDEFEAIEGRLLLAQALIQLKEHEAATELLDLIEVSELGSEQKWKLEFLRTQAYEAAGELERALQAINNVQVLADLTSDPQHQADTHTLKAGLLEKSGRPEEAAMELEANLRPQVPQVIRRSSFNTIVKLWEQSDQTSTAISRLQELLTSNSEDPLLDLVRFTLGELYLKRHLSLERINAERAEPPRDFLELAEEQFQAIVEKYPNSPMLGKTYLKLGESFREMRSLDEARSAYEKAAPLLPDDTDRLLARFRLGEIDFRQANYAQAEQSFQKILDDYREKRDLSEDVFATARSYMVRSALALDEPERALEMVSEFESLYPLAPKLIESRLLVCQYLTEEGRISDARAELQSMLREYPESSLVPQIWLALIKTYAETENWGHVLTEYEWWMAEFPNNPSFPEVKYDLAWATYQYGEREKSLNLLLEFIEQNPAHPKAPEAQMFIGNDYLKRGLTDPTLFAKAEENFQLVFEKWPESSLQFQARILAGRAAFERQAYQDAMEYFRVIMESSDNSIPENAVADAYIGYADALIKSQTPTGNPDFSGAINALDQFQKRFPNNSQVPVAKARMAQIYFQSKNYDQAVQLFKETLQSEAINNSVRTQTLIGLAQTIEKQADQMQGQERQTKLLEAKAQLEAAFYPARVEEEPDPFWMARAGVELARISAQVGELDQSARLYERLIEEHPTLSSNLKPLLEEVEIRQNSAKL